MRESLRGVASAAVLLLGLSGCGSETADGPGEVVATGLDLAALFAERNGVSIEEAPSALGMSSETHDAYMEALERGYVLSSDLQRVMPDLIECVSAAGLAVVYDPTREGLFGLPDVGWGVVFPEGREPTVAEDELVMRCADRTVGPLENVYFNQPYSPERAEVWSTDGRRELAHACIESAGYAVRPEGSMQEYLEVAKRIIDDGGSSDCFDIVIGGSAQ